jgi:hypothetical protein
MTNRRASLFTMVDVAKKMIGGEIGPIEGSRTIAQLRLDVGYGEDAAFLPFRRIKSESDDIVVGERSLWAQDFLDKIDRRYAEYDDALRGGIAEDCEALLALFDPKLRECAACGIRGLQKPPYDAAGQPSYETCPCCSFEPGVTDEIEYDVAEWRRRWVGKGMPFRHPPPPDDWDPVAQMRSAGLLHGQL